jgi:hypothetical protein
MCNKAVKVCYNQLAVDATTAQLPINMSPTNHSKDPLASKIKLVQHMKAIMASQQDLLIEHFKQRHSVHRVTLVALCHQLGILDPPTQQKVKRSMHFNHGAVACSHHASHPLQNLSITYLLSQQTSK